MREIVVVDCQNDFITGSLACLEAENACKEIINMINQGNCRVYYTMDWHAPTNQSFKENGGIWPVHCVQGTWGSELYDAFSKDVEAHEQKPNPNNMYLKGLSDEIEEYSAYAGRNAVGKTLSDIAADLVIVVGIAGEFCVRETVLDFLRNQKKVVLIENMMGYVNEEEQEKNLSDLKSKGVVVVKNLQELLDKGI